MLRQRRQRELLIPAALPPHIRRRQANGRLAARKMHLKDAERRRFAKHPRPAVGVEFVVARFKLERV